MFASFAGDFDFWVLAESASQTCVAMARCGGRHELNEGRERITVTFLDTLAVRPVSIQARKT